MFAIGEISGLESWLFNMQWNTTYLGPEKKYPD